MQFLISIMTYSKFMPIWDSISNKEIICQLHQADVICKDLIMDSIIQEEEQEDHQEEVEVQQQHLPVKSLHHWKSQEPQRVLLNWENSTLQLLVLQNFTPMNIKMDQSMLYTCLMFHLMLVFKFISGKTSFQIDKLSTKKTTVWTQF